MERFLLAKNLDIGAAGSFKQGCPGNHCRVSPQSIYEAGLEIGSAEVVGLFISCTSLRVSPILAKLEADLGKPEIASNQALAWHATRLAGCANVVKGCGQLLTTGQISPCTP